MHAANVEHSSRLLRALFYIKSAGKNGCTTAELQSYSESMAPATDVSELRQSGYLIECRRDGTTHGGRKIYRYTYLGRSMSAKEVE
jgi:hypothetical protein